jgi:hypothetical protein
MKRPESLDLLYFRDAPNNPRQTSRCLFGEQLPV